MLPVIENVTAPVEATGAPCNYDLLFPALPDNGPTVVSNIVPKKALCERAVVTKVSIILVGVRIMNIV